MESPDLITPKLRRFRVGGANTGRKSINDVYKAYGDVRWGMHHRTNSVISAYAWGREGTGGATVWTSVSCTAKRRDCNEPGRHPSLIATIIDSDPARTWTTYEARSPNSKRISSTGWEGGNLRGTNQGLVGVKRASAHRTCPHSLNFTPQRAAVANEKETNPAPGAKTSELALRQLRTDWTGSLPRRHRPNWSSAR